ncbi:protein of unknown function [Azospirillum lipoferum 4B]|uniref:Uncharacterized protein n=1 Tax=Azospirillum lipoferum (strain 4B) TaxID=862719 RepID=G7Z1Q2_AZOL4|nr:protein of unknown function [Azospirillum lipoferum 4B]
MKRIHNWLQNIVNILHGIRSSIVSNTYRAQARYYNCSRSHSTDASVIDICSPGVIRRSPISIYRNGCTGKAEVF